jgi:hypothetical protein
LAEGDVAIWNTVLRLARTSRRAFDIYIQRLIGDTKTAENDPKFYQIMYAMNQAYVTDDTGTFDPTTLALPSAFSSTTAASGATVLCRQLARLPPGQQARLLGIVGRMAGGQSSALVRYVSGATTLFNRVRGNVVLVGLSAVYLGWEAIQSIRAWWRGEISGKRCAKRVIDATVTFGAGLGGGAVGAAVGGLVGPIGSLAGAVIGGLVASYGAEQLIDWLTQAIFDLPKDVALENAYRFLGVSPSASNSEINTAFRRLCLRYHPDKGGDEKKFHELQSHMTIIKQHRGE